MDRAFYAALSEEESAALGDLVPEGFRFLVKAHQSLTRPDADVSGATFGDTARWRDSGVANPHFLDPSVAADLVVRPLVAGLAERLGPIVFQFPPLDLRPEGRLNGGQAFLERLDRFLRSLPSLPSGSDGLAYVVEVRNRELLAPPLIATYGEVLARSNVAHGFAVHPTLPPVFRQGDALRSAGWPVERQPTCSVRWLLGHNQGYDEAKLRYEPFDRIVDPDPSSRCEIVALVRRALDAGKLAWIIANNKAEGSAPLTLAALAEGFAGGASAPG